MSELELGNKAADYSKKDDSFDSILKAECSSLVTEAPAVNTECLGEIQTDDSMQLTSTDCINSSSWESVHGRDCKENSNTVDAPLTHRIEENIHQNIDSNQEVGHPTVQLQSPIQTNVQSQSPIQTNVQSQSPIQTDVQSQSPIQTDAQSSSASVDHSETIITTEPATLTFKHRKSKDVLGPYYPEEPNILLNPQQKSYLKSDDPSSRSADNNLIGDPIVNIPQIHFEENSSSSVPFFGTTCSVDLVKTFPSNQTDKSSNGLEVYNVERLDKTTSDNYLNVGTLNRRTSNSSSRKSSNASSLDVLDSYSRKSSNASSVNISDDASRKSSMDSLDSFSSGNSLDADHFLTPGRFYEVRKTSCYENQEAESFISGSQSRKSSAQNNVLCHSKSSDSIDEMLKQVESVQTTTNQANEMYETNQNKSELAYMTSERHEREITTNRSLMQHSRDVGQQISTNQIMSHEMTESTNQSTIHHSREASPQTLTNQILSHEKLTNQNTIQHSSDTSNKTSTNQILSHEMNESTNQSTMQHSRETSRRTLTDHISSHENLTNQNTIQHSSETSHETSAHHENLTNQTTSHQITTHESLTNQTKVQQSRETSHSTREGEITSQTFSYPTQEGAAFPHSKSHYTEDQTFIEHVRETTQIVVQSGMKSGFDDYLPSVKSGYDDYLPSMKNGFDDYLASMKALKMMLMIMTVCKTFECPISLPFEQYYCTLCILLYSSIEIVHDLSSPLKSCIIYHLHTYYMTYGNIY